MWRWCVLNSLIRISYWRSYKTSLTTIIPNLPLHWRTPSTTWIQVRDALQVQSDVPAHCRASFGKLSKCQPRCCSDGIYFHFPCTQSSCVPCPYPIAPSPNPNWTGQSRNFAYARCTRPRSLRTCFSKCEDAWFRGLASVSFLWPQRRYAGSKLSSLAKTETSRYQAFL